ncbi:hypothetical protein BRC87_02900 [Halobacteriales archaeon QS_4_66_20]|nr:MAG: hypothetical protein BRC87_02900 [Halobacteriales archaeon QS_4_66_20]
MRSGRSVLAGGCSGRKPPHSCFSFRKLTEDNARFVRDISTTVTDTDLYRFRVAIPVEDAVLVVAMNNALTVLSVERTARDEVTELPTN